jgi:hypothetical protein
LFRRHLGIEHAIATSSCTGAMHMGLSALGVGWGDEVILADVNWIASAAPVTYLGAKPVLIDILPDTWCLDPAKVEAAITPRTKAMFERKPDNVVSYSLYERAFNLPSYHDLTESEMDRVVAVIRRQLDVEHARDRVVGSHRPGQCALRGTEGNRHRGRRDRGQSRAVLADSWSTGSARRARVGRLEGRSRRARIRSASCRRSAPREPPTAMANHSSAGCSRQASSPCWSPTPRSGQTASAFASTWIRAWTRSC